MENFYLDFTVDGMYLARRNYPPIFDGSYKFIHAKFKFSKDWDNAEKFLLLARNNETYSVKLEADECLFSFEAISTAGKFDMQVVGSRDDVRMLTNAITIDVGSSEMKNNPSGEETRFTNDFVITSLAEINRLLNETTEASNNAKISELNASTYAARALNIASDLPEQVTEYISTHKEELKGYTPIKGIDYFDGKDGKPGKDGVDGAPGKDGVDGKDGKDGVDGYTPQKGIDYFDGKDGKDGEIPADKLAQIDENTESVQSQLLQIQHIEGKVETLEKRPNITDEHINDLIDIKLGVIENGYY